MTLEVLDAHTIATQAAVTVKTPAGEHYTSTCMILPDKTGTDLERLETLNAAARQICAAPPPLEHLPLCLNRRPCGGPGGSWWVICWDLGPLRCSSAEA